MPLKGARYRVKTTASGKKVRLAFKGKGRVVEAKKTSLKGKGANRTLKGTDKRRPSKGVEGWMPKRLEGKYF